MDRVHGASSRAFASPRPVRVCPRVSSRRCAVGIGDEKCLAVCVSWSFRVAGVGNSRGGVGVEGMVDVHFAWQARGMVRPRALAGIVLRGRFKPLKSSHISGPFYCL